MQSNSSNIRRRYDREFKQQAVALIQSGRSITELSRDLGVSQWSLSRWLKATQSGEALSEPSTLSSETSEQREIRRLRQENDYLRRQRDILKKAWSILSAEGAAQRFEVMATMKATSHCLTQMADALEISKSGFHAHRRKAERPRAKQDKQLGDAIEPIFVASRRTYGSPRIMQALRKSGWRCGKNRIARLMRSRGLRARQKRRFRPKTTQSDHQLPVVPNWLAKILEPDRPGQVWLGDIILIMTCLAVCQTPKKSWLPGSWLRSEMIPIAWAVLKSSNALPELPRLVFSQVPLVKGKYDGPATNSLAAPFIFGPIAFGNRAPGDGFTTKERKNRARATPVHCVALVNVFSKSFSGC